MFETGPPPPLAPRDSLGLSRSTTLPRKSGSTMSMVGRPLPPPPPVTSAPLSSRGETFKNGRYWIDRNVGLTVLFFDVSFW